MNENIDEIEKLKTCAKSREYIEKKLCINSFELDTYLKHCDKKALWEADNKGCR